MTATVIILPTLVDRVLAEPTPGLRYLLRSELCIDPDPEMTALLAEPVPARGLSDIIRFMIGEQE